MRTRRPDPEPLRGALARLRPSPFRLKVAVFMLPLLLPVGQNLSQRPAGADGGGPHAPHAPRRAAAEARPAPAPNAAAGAPVEPA